MPSNSWLRSRLRVAEHGVRRALARRRLARERFPTLVLFVCQGNIYRSPFAAERFRNRLPAGLRRSVAVESAGFEAPGRPVPEPARACAAGRGVDLAEHRSSLLTADLVREADLIVVVDPRHAAALRRRYRMGARRFVVLGDLDPLQPSSRTIEDPLGRSVELLAGTYARIDRCVDVLADTVLTRLREDEAIPTDSEPRAPIDGTGVSRPR